MLSNSSNRQGDFSRLTVSVLASNYSRTYSSYVGSDSSLINVPADASLYVGALPPRDMVCFLLIFPFKEPSYEIRFWTLGHSYDVIFSLVLGNPSSTIKK